MLKEITFKYNGKIISTPNLEKKLKRMKISMEDIEIINNLPEKEETNTLDDFHLTHLPYYEPIEGGYALHYLPKDKDYPSNWIPLKIVNNKLERL